MTSPNGDPATLTSDLMDLIDASTQHGRAIERVDPHHAEKAQRAELDALERILLRVDPARVDEARAILVRARAGARP